MDFGWGDVDGLIHEGNLGVESFDALPVAAHEPGFLPVSDDERDLVLQCRVGGVVTGTEAWGAAADEIVHHWSAVVRRGDQVVNLVSGNAAVLAYPVVSLDYLLPDGAELDG